MQVDWVSISQQPTLVNTTCFPCTDELASVIIFDSDWNPQNDIQAQARCHRIGQKQLVKVYRLVTKNSYEWQMFDRSSKKLGLDQAVLSNINNEFSEKSQKQPVLDKQAIDALLKYGAYDLLSKDDDEASRRFCEEDIDKILERATTVVHKTEEVGLSSFSKASFASSTAGTIYLRSNMAQLLNSI